MCDNFVDVPHTWGGGGGSTVGISLVGQIDDYLNMVVITSINIALRQYRVQIVDAVPMQIECPSIKQR